MAELSEAMRGDLPQKKFGLPAQRKYPMPDKAHAANAKARASEEHSKGNLSTEMKSHIDKMADTILKN